MKIDKSQVKLVFIFSPAEYFLCKSDDQKTGFPYSLNFRIDRSEKGKCDDVGMARIYLDDFEAEEARKNGFSELSY